MPLYRVTRKANPSERFDVEFDDVFVAGGLWAFGRSTDVDAAAGARDVVGSWPTTDWTVEVQEHGDAWRQIDPDTSVAED